MAKDHRTRAVGSVQLKDVLGEIEADGAHWVHGRLLEWALTPPLWHAEAVGGVHTCTFPSGPFHRGNVLRRIGEDYPRRRHTGAGIAALAGDQRQGVEGERHQRGQHFLGR